MTSEVFAVSVLTYTSSSPIIATVGPDVQCIRRTSVVFQPGEATGGSRIPTDTNLNG
jgi:hypothetical protein